MKRFYKDVSVAEAGVGWQVLLDSRPVRTPDKTLLILPNEPLAVAVADEWRGQGETLSPRKMPLFRLASAAIDGAGASQERIARVLKYGVSDALCYRATEPPPLIARQAAWDEWLDWAASDLGAPLRATSGAGFIEQPAASLAALKRHVAALDEYHLTALSAAVPMLGSLVLGLALVKGEIDAGTAFTLSQIEEEFQAEKWGRDVEAEARCAVLREELNAIGRFLAFL